MLETLIAYLAMPWVQVVIGLVVGWLGLPRPTVMENTWWSKLIAPIFGTGQAATNVTELVAIVMSLLKMNGQVAHDAVAPDPKTVQKVADKKLTLNEASRSHKIMLASAGKK
jgi:hypothetical protein